MGVHFSVLAQLRRSCRRLSTSDDWWIVGILSGDGKTRLPKGMCQAILMLTRFVERSERPLTTVGPTETLDKLHLIKGICVLQAAVVALGKEVLPAYPQCGLRMARFRGVTKEPGKNNFQIC